jgi:hypothetical protein
MTSDQIKVNKWGIDFSSNHLYLQSPWNNKLPIEVQTEPMGTVELL